MASGRYRSGRRRTSTWRSTEDEHDRLTKATPIPLASAGDRIGQIVQTSIAEVPHIEVREFPAEADPSVGYVSVVVPQSARAPHMVVVGGESRYHGRGAKGNRILSEAEVAMLYRRRNEWEQDQEALLAAAVASAPFRPSDDYAFLHCFARPLVPDRAIWDRAVAAEGGQEELQNQPAAAAANVRPTQHMPSFRGQVWWEREGADVWRLSSSYDTDYEKAGDASHATELRLNVDGRGSLFCGRAAERITQTNRMPQPPSVLMIWEGVIAGNAAAFFVPAEAVETAAECRRDAVAARSGLTFAMQKVEGSNPFSRL